MQRNGWRIMATRRPLSRGVRYTMERGDASRVAYSRAEMHAIADGSEFVLGALDAMPGPRAAIVRPARKYI